MYSSFVNSRALVLMLDSGGSICLSVLAFAYKRRDVLGRRLANAPGTRRASARWVLPHCYIGILGVIAIWRRCRNPQSLSAG